MPKILLFVIVLVVVIATGFATLFFSTTTKVISRSEIDTAINQANFLYLQRKAIKEDFSSGPCLSNALMPGWVVDIVHSPRSSIDELPENQCSAYIEGKATHFVELDTEGNLIRAK